jgi:mannose-6-phosphate isomerase-like protein (cupin superfamily)
MDRRIDMFMGDWRESQPRIEYGSLVLRDILTHGDNLNPSQKGAVLSYLNFVSYGTLGSGESTIPSQLSGSQDILYFTGGDGVLSAGGKTVGVHKDIAVLMPAQLEFVISSKGTQALTMYVINEPIPAGFRPNPGMLVKDENTTASRLPEVQSPLTLPGASGHWAHFVRPLFDVQDGLGTLMGFITVTIQPMTLGEPHPHRPGQEEIWVALEGESLALLGTQLRLQRPGMAYMPRTDSTMLHSNINANDRPAKFLWFSRSRDHEVRK